MANSYSGFNPATFRDGITFAMNMGMANNAADKVTFYFERVRTYPLGTALDENGDPYDASIAPTETEPTPVVIPVAVEFAPATTDELPVGVLQHTKLTLTILDTNWPDVEDAIEVGIGDDRYIIEYEKPVIGMFDVDVHQLVCFAKDES